jgi:Protein of unknown function (DUF3987)
MIDDLTAFLAGFRPGGCITFVGIVPDGSTVAETFNGADPGKAAAWIEGQNRARGVYFTVNPTAAGLRKKPLKSDITAISAVWADVDPRDGNRGEWLQERERLLALADELAALTRPPSFIVDSGNGIQPVWALAEPIEATPEYREAAEQLCGRIEHALGASGTHNVDRLLRVPGTTNFPNQKKRDLGRGETQARLPHATWQRYSWHDLEALATDLEANPPAHARPVKRQRARSNGHANGANGDLPPYPSRDATESLLRDPTATAYWHQSFSVVPGNDRSPSGWDLAFAGYLASTGLSRDEIAGFLRAYRAHHEPTKGKQDRASYIFATVDQAIGEIEGEDEIFTDDSKKASSGQADNDPWPDPIPIFAEHEKPEPYPIDALPPIIRAAVEAYQAFGQQPIELVACSALSAASLACQALADVDRDGNLLGPCSLSFIIVAKSGERKTACDRRMRRALERWQDAKQQEQAPVIKAAKRQLEIWQTQHDGILAKIKRLSGSTKPDDEIERKTLVSKLILLDADRPIQPQEIILFHEDATPEKLAGVLATSWPSASLWSDEAGLVVGSHAMSEESAMRFLGLLNRLWDGGTFRRERETRSSAYVRGRRFTVALMLQPGVLGRLTVAGDGIARGIGALARFLMTWPSSTIGARAYCAGNLDDPALLAFDARLRRLLEMPLPLDEDGGLRPPALRLSPAAFEVWRALHDDVERELGRRGEFSELTDFGAKAAEHAARIACVLHVFEHGSVAGEIGPEMMLAGAQIAIWHLSEARRVFAIVGHAGEAADAQALLEWLQDHHAPSLRDVLRLGPYRLRDKKCRDGAIARLVEHGLVRVEKHGEAERIALNPKVNP